MNLLDRFETYLIERGYREFTPKGNKSTVYDYSYRIRFVCDEERINVENLFVNIEKFVTLYDVGGIKEDLGRKSHNSVISALKRFKEFKDEVL